MAASPSSSPRLPSPPPMAEDQLGPKSPIAIQEDAHNPFEANALRRIRPGTKATDMAMGPPLVPLTEIDSPFQLAEHLKSLHNAALHRDGSSTISPIDRETALKLAQPPEGVDKYLWLYELCRLLCKETNSMIVALFQDDPPCSAQTCTEMRASEWQYLCAVHDPPKPCCAIDYCCHTLDWTNNVLTSQKNFPSRLSVGADGGTGTAQLRQLTNIFRRVYRIFAHAWFQHRDMYWKVELKSGLYVFFKTVCDCYNLIPEDNYTVPPEAEGLEPLPAPEQKTPSIMKREEDDSGVEDTEQSGLKPATGNSHPTQRHRHTPSVGSESITTVLEETEEDDDKHSKMDDTMILMTDVTVDTPAEDMLGESANREDKVTLESEAEAHNPSSIPATEIPTIAVEEITKEPGDAADLAVTDSGEKAESTASVSDTDSHGSWQVLTDESQSTDSSDGAASMTESATEPEAGEAGTATESSDSPIPTKPESDPEPQHSADASVELKEESETEVSVQEEHPEVEEPVSSAKVEESASTEKPEEDEEKPASISKVEEPTQSKTETTEETTGTTQKDEMPQSKSQESIDESLEAKEKADVTKAAAGAE